MKVNDIVKTLDAHIVCGEDRQDYAIHVAFASDLMSDVLTLKNDHVLLITGLANMQTIRTAEMSDINCIVFARNKKAVPVLGTHMSAFGVTGKIYELIN